MIENRIGGRKHVRTSRHQTPGYIQVLGGGRVYRAYVYPCYCDGSPHDFQTRFIAARPACISNVHANRRRRLWRISAVRKMSAKKYHVKNFPRSRPFAAMASKTHKLSPPPRTRFSADSSKTFAEASLIVRIFLLLWKLLHFHVTQHFKKWKFPNLKILCIYISYSFS